MLWIFIRFMIYCNKHLQSFKLRYSIAIPIYRRSRKNRLFEKNLNVRSLVDTDPDSCFFKTITLTYIQNKAFTFK